MVDVVLELFEELKQGKSRDRKLTDGSRPAYFVAELHHSGAGTCRGGPHPFPFVGFL